MTGVLISKQRDHLLRRHGPREQEALQNFHIAVATIEGLVGNPFSLTHQSSR